MNREDIIRMAREAGDADRIDPFTKDGDWVILTPDELERFAALVASAEREACVQIVESEAMQYAEPVWAFEIVNDIRARGNS